MGSLYGDKQGKQFRIWVDKLSSSQFGSDAWLVKFDKWELSGEIHVIPLICVCMFVFLFG